MKDVIEIPENFKNKGFNQSSWFCVQTHPKHEHIAGRCLTKDGGIEVFNPQMRTRRATKRGPVWFTESVFPGYIFARFNIQTQLDMVRYSPGVTKVVQFNSFYPRVPDFQVNELLAVFGENKPLDLTAQLITGDTVRILSGVFQNLLAVVQFVQPTRQRVRALLEFLGRMTSVELDIHNVTVEHWGGAVHHPLYRSESLAYRDGRNPWGNRQG